MARSRAWNRNWRLESLRPTDRDPGQHLEGGVALVHQLDVAGAVVARRVQHGHHVVGGRRQQPHLPQRRKKT